MPRLVVDADVSGREPADVLATIADFERYPGYTDTIKALRVDREGDDEFVSHWEVEFRGGIMTWSERDRVDRAAHALDFEQIEGESEQWEGRWQVDGRRLRFHADFELGIPSLSEQLNPLAMRALYDVVADIVRGAFGDDAEIVSSPPS